MKEEPKYPLVNHGEKKKMWTGAWIPKELFNDFKLSWFSKILWTEIQSLDNSDGCYALNSFLAKKLHVSTRTIQRGIKELLEHKYITVKIINHSKRIIKISMKLKHD